MKKMAAIFVLFATSVAIGQTLYEGYEDFYRDNFNSIFSVERSTELQVNYTGKDGIFSLAGSAAFGKKKQTVKIAKGRIQLNGVNYKLADVRPFKDQSVNTDDLGRGTRYFYAADAACFENVPSSASGSAVRHTAVYLIAPVNNAGARVFIKLPSLFASCLAISRDALGNFEFPLASYRYAENELEAEGIDFNLYIYKSRRFERTGERKSIRFLDKENLYKFIDSAADSLETLPLTVHKSIERFDTPRAERL